MDYQIKVYGTESCPDTIMTRAHLEERRLPYEFVRINQDPEAEQQVIDWGHGKRKIPVVEIRSEGGKTHRLTEPSNEELDRALRQSHVDA